MIPSMGMSAPKAAPVAAAPKQSALDIQKAQNDVEEDLIRRRGRASTIHAGETGQDSYQSSVLG